jgi:hypothetical protein
LEEWISVVKQARNFVSAADPTSKISTAKLILLSPIKNQCKNEIQMVYRNNWVSN